MVREQLDERQWSKVAAILETQRGAGGAARTTATSSRRCFGSDVLPGTGTGTGTFTGAQFEDRP